MNKKIWLTWIICIIGWTFSSYAMAEEKQKISPVLIFVSFSMPDTSIKQWMRVAEKIHAPVVIRGLINHSFKDTIKKVADLTHDNQGGVQLDPILFKRFQINQVPAVVVWKETNCLSNQSCLDEYDVVYGDVTLLFALQKIVDQKDNLSPLAAKAYAILHEGDHA